MRMEIRGADKKKNNNNKIGCAEIKEMTKVSYTS